MQSRRIPLSLALVAGLAASPLAHAGGFTCTVSGFSWIGGFSDDFLNGQNWDTCIGIPAPQTNLPVYFGPQALLVNGVFNQWQLPAGPALLTSDYSNPQATMANGVDTLWTIRNAVYTAGSTGVIGDDAPADFIDPGTLATLVLDNAVWTGSIQLGRSGGNGELILRNGGLLTGNLSFGSSSTGVVRNETDTILSDNLNNASSGMVTWVNTGGTSLELQNNAGFGRSWPNDPATLINEAGATIRKTGTGTSNIGWETINSGSIAALGGTVSLDAGVASNNGTVDVLAGAVEFDGPISGHTTVAVAEGGVFQIFGEPAPAASFDIAGEVWLDPRDNGAPLQLSGSYVVGQVGTVGVAVTNLGAATITDSLNNASQAPASWINTAGAQTTFVGSAGLARSWPSSPAEFINQPGSAIIKQGPGTSTFTWALSGSGDIEVQEGTLRLENVITANARVTVAAGADIEIDGLVDPAASFDVTGDISLDPVDNGATLTLSGDYRIIDAGTLGLSVVNLGAATIDDSVNNSSSQPASWLNTAGSELVFFGSAGMSSSWPNSPATLENAPGAIVRKRGDNTSTVAWLLVNRSEVICESGTIQFTDGVSSSDGVFVIDAGEIRVDGPLDGRSTVVAADGASFRLRGTPSPSARFDLLGDVDFGSIFGTGMLTLAGDFRIIDASGTTSGTVINTGDALLSNDSINNNSQNPVTWINEPGSTFIMLGSSGMTRSWPNTPAELVIEHGALLRKTGGSTSTINWLADHRGLIEVDEGRIQFNAGFNSDGGVIEATGTGSARLIGPLSGSVVATATGPDASIGLFGDPSPSFTADITGNAELGSIAGTGTLTLAGAMTVIEANSSTSGTVLNLGEVLLQTESINNSQNPVTWTNEAGSLLVFNDTAGMSRSWPGAPAELIIRPESIVRKIGGGTSTINWDVSHSGAIEVVDGVLALRESFECDGSIAIEGGSRLIVTEATPTLKTLVVSGAGMLEFTTAPALFNRGTLNPAPVDPAADTDGLVIDVPFIQNDDTAVFRTQIGSLAGKLTATGVYDVGGTIDIQRFGDFEPIGSEQFVVIEADFVSGVFGDHFDNAVPLPGSDTAFDVRTGDLEYNVTYTPTQVIVSGVSVFVPPCNPADLAEPGGLLDLADVTAFVQAFVAGDPAADLAEPFGLYDLADVIAFTSAFLAGCP